MILLISFCLMPDFSQPLCLAFPDPLGILSCIVQNKRSRSRKEPIANHKKVVFYELLKLEESFVAIFFKTCSILSKVMSVRTARAIVKFFKPCGESGIDSWIIHIITRRSITARLMKLRTGTGWTAVCWESHMPIVRMIELLYWRRRCLISMRVMNRRLWDY